MESPPEPPAPKPKPNPFIDVAPYESPDPETLTAAPIFYIAPPKVEKPPAPKIPQPLPPDPNIELRHALADLQLESNRLKRQRDSQAAELTAAQQQLAAAKQNLDLHLKNMTAIQQDHEKLRTEDRAFITARKKLLLKIREAEKHLNELQQRQATAPSKFAFVPYDGRQGTARRPIFIECTANGIRFWPENVSLGPNQLEGFTEGYNPLLAGVQALTNHWKRAATLSDGEAVGDPYVMLVVRPEGSIAYYLARKFLTEWKDSYGYELIEDDFDWHIPQADPNAKQELHRDRRGSKSRQDVVRKFAFGGGRGGLSEFPDPDELAADEDLPFTSRTSNASRFAAKNRRHRRKLAQQYSATPGNSRQPGSGIPGGNNNSQIKRVPRGQQNGALAQGNTTAGRPDETGRIGDIPRRFVSADDPTVAEPNSSGFQIGENGTNPQSSPPGAGENPLAENPFLQDEHLTGERSKGGGSTDRRFSEGRTAEGRPQLNVLKRTRIRNSCASESDSLLQSGTKPDETGRKPTDENSFAERMNRMAENDPSFSSAENSQTGQPGGRPGSSDAQNFRVGRSPGSQTASNNGQPSTDSQMTTLESIRKKQSGGGRSSSQPSTQSASNGAPPPVPPHQVPPSILQGNRNYHR